MTLLCSSEGKESLDRFALHVHHILTHEWELVPSIASPRLALFLPLTSSPADPLTAAAPNGFVFSTRTSPKYFQVLISHLNEQYGRFNSYL